ncbi:SAAL1 protein, partial [Polypterus senegalus]
MASRQSGTSGDELDAAISIRKLSMNITSEIALLEDPIVQLNTHDLMSVLKAWLPVLVKTFGSLKNHINIKNIRDLEHGSAMQEGIIRIEDAKVEKTIEVDSESISFDEQNNTCTEKKKWQESANLILNKEDVKDYNHLNGENDSQQAYDVTLVPQKDITENEGEAEMYEDQMSMRSEHSKTNLDTLDEKNTIECVHNTVDRKEYTWEQMQISPPPDLSSELHQDLTELATLCFEMSCFQSEEHGSHCTSERGDESVMACSFLQQYFFLLDLERVRRCCLIHYRDYPVVWDTYIAGLKALTLSCQETTFLGERNLLKSLKCLRDSALCSTPFLLAHLTRLYEMHGELAIRSFGQFYPTILPADVLAMSRNHPAHFLAYLDNLIKSKPEEERAPLLSSFLQPECLRHEWLELALSHDAPQLADTINPLGNPRSRSHLFPWGYGQLLKLLIKLPGSLSDKEKIAKSALPETVDEWKCILQIAKHKAEEPESPNGSEKVNGVVDWSSRSNLENVILLLARTTGPERAFEILQECGLNIELSERSALVSEDLMDFVTASVIMYLKRKKCKGYFHNEKTWGLVCLGKEKRNSEYQDNESSISTGSDSSPGMDRNPSPPASDDEDDPVDDAIGDTAYSKHWLVRTLTKLIQPLSNQHENAEGADESSQPDLDEDIESEICKVWDMSMDQEICVGILGNIACFPETCQSISRNDDLGLLLTCLSQPEVSPCWIERIKNQKTVCENICFIMSSSTSVDLLVKVGEVVDKMFDLDEELMRHWIGNAAEASTGNNREDEEPKAIADTLGIAPCLLEAIKQLRHESPDGLEVYMHILQLLTTVDEGIQAIVVSAEIGENTWSLLCDIVCNDLCQPDDPPIVIQEQKILLASILSVLSAMFACQSQHAYSKMDRNLKLIGSLFRVLQYLRECQQRETNEQSKTDGVQEEQMTILQETCCEFLSNILTELPKMQHFFGVLMDVNKKLAMNLLNEFPILKP